jgi:D-aspartate ligase
MSRPTPLACVMGDMDLLRPIGRAGIPCAVVSRPGAPQRYSRFTTTVVGWSDAWERPAELVESLLRFAATQRERPVLFYEEDRELLLVSRYRDRLRPAFRFVVPARDLVEELVDKSRFQGLARRLELPVPRATLLRASDGLAGVDAVEQFPVVVKPLTRRTDRWEPVAGMQKAVRVDSRRELREMWSRLAAAGMEVLAQELIEGGEDRIESYHAYVDEQGEIVGEFTGRKLRTHPVSFGHSTALVLTDAADVRELGREVLWRLDLRGVAKLDFKRSADGRLYLFEVNPRFNLWHHLGAVAGVNLPALVYGDLVGLPRPAWRAARAGATWCKPWRDLAAARSLGVPLFRWAAWTFRADAHRLLSRDDLMPVIRSGLFECRESLARLLGARAESPRAPRRAELPA